MVTTTSTCFAVVKSSATKMPIEAVEEAVVEGEEAVAEEAVVEEAVVEGEKAVVEEAVVQGGKAVVAASGWWRVSCGGSKRACCKAMGDAMREIAL
jgi:hypothetical protein